MKKTRLAILVTPLLLVAAGLMVYFLPSRFPESRQALREFVYGSVLGAPLIDGYPRREVECKSLNGSRTLVAVAFGQSNSANFGRGRYRPLGPVFSFHQGRCYQALDPMLGADGGGGSVWSRLGDKLVADRLYDRVIFATLGVGGTAVARWRPMGDLHPRLLDALRFMQAAGLVPTHLLWHQGEADAASGTSREAYKAMFKQMLASIRTAGVNAPIYVSVASYCYGERSSEIQRAQVELVDMAENILPGPNTDAISGPGDRYDDCHFSEAGLLKYQDAWLDRLKI